MTVGYIILYITAMLSGRHKFCSGARVAQKRLLPELLIAVAVCMFLWGIASAETRESREGQSVTVIDQLGRTVTVPAGIERIAALHFLPGKIVFALHEQDKLVCQGLLRDEGKAMARIDPVFASKPSMMPGTFGIEALMACAPMWPSSTLLSTGQRSGGWRRQESRSLP